MTDAEIASHRAKGEGKDRWTVFESGMQDLVQRQVTLEKDLRGALDRGEFFLVYQPTLDLRRMIPTGVEALIRWRCPTRGLVQPNDFIPALEDSGLIVAVGQWVLEQACMQSAAWRNAGFPVGIAVNVSARQLDGDEFIGVVEAALAATRTRCARPHARDHGDGPDAQRRGDRRAAAGDQGAGGADRDRRLRHGLFLARTPAALPRRRPEDRPLVPHQLAENPEGETLIRTLVQLGKALSIETLAEGIERAHELTLLQEENCDSGQGYLFARPLEVGEAEEFLRSWRPEHAGLAQAAPSAG